MNAVELIERDHREVEQLFREWEQGDPGARRDVVQTIIRELSVHAAIEEQVLYPAMRRLLPDGERLMQEAIQEHQEAKEVLSDLEAKGPEDPGFTQKVGALIQDVRHHVEEEERELLPSLASAMSDQELDELGERLEIARRAAPTRPHPHAPSTPPGNIAADPTT